jgi:hypothetical protein
MPRATRWLAETPPLPAAGCSALHTWAKSPGQIALGGKTLLYADMHPPSFFAQSA